MRICKYKNRTKSAIWPLILTTSFHTTHLQEKIEHLNKQQHLKKLPLDLVLLLTLKVRPAFSKGKVHLSKRLHFLTMGTMNRIYLKELQAFENLSPSQKRLNSLLLLLRKDIKKRLLILLRVLTPVHISQKWTRSAKRHQRHRWNKFISKHKPRRFSNPKFQWMIVDLLHMQVWTSIQG